MSAGYGLAGGYARYVGRVGALAVALGIGAAVAGAPGIAWAGPDADTTVDNPDTTAGAGTPGAGTPGEETQGTGETPSGVTGVATPPPSVVTAQTTDPDPDPDPDPADKPPAVVDPREGGVVASGGFNTTVTNRDGTTTTPTPSTPTPAAAPPPPAGNPRTVIAPVTEPSQPNNNNPPQAKTPIPAGQGVPAGNAGPAPTAPPTPAAKQLAAAAIDPPPPAAPTALRTFAAQTQTQALDSGPADPPATGFRALVSGFLAAVGLGPSAAPGPLAPVEAPGLWAMLAFAVRRQLGQPDPSTALTTAALLTTGQTLDEAQPQSFAMFAALVANDPPVASGPPTVSGPHPVTGVVTGSLNVTDPNGDPLSYTVTGNAGSGSVTVNPNGTFTYTPTQAARLAANQTMGPDADAFTVTVSDGTDSLNVAVNVTVGPGELSVGPTSTTVGTSPAGMVTANNRTYVANLGSNTVSVINPSTNTVVATIAVVGSPAALAASPDGTKVYVAGNNSVSVINTATNTVTATPFIFVGQSYGIAVTATRAYITGTSGQVAVLNTANNIVLARIRVGNSPAGITLSPDGTRAYVANNGSNTVSVINTATNTVVGTVALGAGSQPWGIASNPLGTRVYVANRGAGTVSVINTATNTTIGSPITVGTQPYGITMSPDGSLAYVGNSNDTVSVINTATNTVIRTLTIDTAPETGPHFIAFTPDGLRAYVSDLADNRVRSINLASTIPNSAPVAGATTIGATNATTGAVAGTVTATDPDNNAITYTVTGAPAGGTVTVNPTTGAYTYTPSQAARLAASQGSTDAFTVTATDGQLSVNLPVTVPVTAATLSLDPTTSATGTSPAGIVLANGRTYVANLGSNNVTVINTATGQVVATIRVVSSPVAVAASPDGTKVYVAGNNSVSVINTATNTVTATPFISVGQSYGIAVTATRAYITGTSGQVAVLNTANNIVLARIRVGNSPAGITLSPDGTRAYVANNGSNTVSVINTATNTVVGTVALGAGSQPWGIASNPLGSRVYTSNLNGTVSVINTATNTVVGSPITVGTQPYGITVSPDGSLAYVANGNDTVTVINTKTNTVLRTLTIDQTPETAPHLITLNADGTRAYITDYADGLVRTLTLASSATNQAPVVATSAGATSYTEQASPAVIDNGLTITDPDSPTVTGATVSIAAPSSAETLAFTVPAGSGITGSYNTMTGVLTLTGTSSVANYQSALRSVTFASTSDNPAASKTVTFEVNDGTNPSASATKTVSITAVNDGPALTLPTSGTLTPDANGDVVFTVGGTDPEGAPVTFSANTTQGSVSTVTPTSFRYTPGDYAHALAADGYTGPLTATITVTATDSAGGTTTSTLTVPVTPTNAEPAPTGTVTAGAPNSDGAVPISFPVSDADRDPLTFTDDSAKGDVQIVNGALVFVPTYAARHAASADTATPADKQATFTITANDGHGGTTSTTVTVDIASSGVVGTVTIPGGAVGAPQFFADGTRAVQTTVVSTYAAGVTTSTTRVVVIDTTTGTQIGTTTTLTGSSIDTFGESYYPAQINADSTRAVQTTRQETYVDGVRTYSTRVAVIDLTTGSQIGTTTALAGYSDGTQFSADGTRFTQTTRETIYDNTTGTYVSSKRVAVIDVTTGTLIGITSTTTTLAGSGWTQSTADGTRAVQTTREETNVDGVRTYTTRVAVIDLTTGAQLGTTITLAGSGATQLSADGTRAVLSAPEQTYVNGIGYTYTTRAAVIDLTTGTQIGTTITLAGSGATQLSADGTRAVLSATEGTYANGVYTYTTRAAVIDLTTGTQLGSITTLPGYVRDTELSADGTRAVLTSSTYDNATLLSTTRLAVIDLTTGAQVGTTFTLAGEPEQTKFFADGTRAIQTTRDEMDDVNGVSTYTTRVAVIDTTTGAQMGATTTLGGYLTTTLLSADETRAIQIASDHDSTSYAYVTRIAVIDLTTGTQVGTTTTVPGEPRGGGPGQGYNSTQLTADGTRVIQTTSGYDYGTGGYITRVAFIDVATGTQSGTITTLVGSPAGGMQFNADGTRATQSTSASGGAQVAVIDVTTGAQIGTTITLTGHPQGGAQFSADGTRATQTTYVYDNANAVYTYTTRVAVIDVTTGTQVGVSPPLDGYPTGAARFSTDGTHITQTTTAYDRITFASTTFVTVVNLDQTGSNQRPTVTTTAPTVGDPDADGVVTGSVELSDPDGDTLGYVGTGATPKGIVTVAADGSFTYTPNTAARLAAAKVTATTADKQDTFAITAYDGHGGATSTLVTVTILPKNTAPVANSTLVDFSNGTLTGKTTGTDVDGDTLTYSVTTQGTRGTAQIDPTTGAFTYTPTAAARDAAAETANDVDTDTFTITVDDGHEGRTTSTVTVEVLQSGVIADADVDLPAAAGLQYSPDGSRAIRVAVVQNDSGSNRTYTTSIAVIDTATGVQIGDTVTIDGEADYYNSYSYGHLQYSADGAYASQTTRATTYANGVYTDTTRVAIIDTATGEVTVTTLAGTPTFAAKFTPDGTHAIQAATVYTYGYDDNNVYTVTYDTEVAIIDTATGAVTRVDLPYGISSPDYQDGITLDATGTRVILRAYQQSPEQTTRVVFVDVATGDLTEFSLAGTGYNMQLNADRTRLVVEAFDYPSGGGQITASRIAVVDTATGLQVGSVVELTGQHYGYSSNADRSQIIVGTETFVPSTGTITRLTAIDVATGTQVGSTLTVAGQLNQISYTPDGTRAIIATSYNGRSITVIDTSSFTQVGTTFTVLGDSSYGTEFSADGSRAIVSTSSGSQSSGYTTHVALVNTITGAQIGTAVSATGYGSARFNADESRIVLTTNSSTNGNSGSTRVTVIDAATGLQIGSTVAVLGSGQPSLSSDGTRATIVATTHDYVTHETSDTRVAIVDLTTGTQVGTTLVQSGSAHLTYSADGSRAAMSAREGDSEIGYTSRVVLLNTVTGAQIGDTFTLAGIGQATFSPDSSRVILSTGDYSDQDDYTRFAVLDAASGAQVGSTLTLTGNSQGVTFTPDGARAILTSYTNYPYDTQVALVDIVTGMQVGDTVTVPGYVYVYDSSFNSDGTRAVLDFYSNGNADKTHRVLILNTVTGATQTFALHGQKYGESRFTSHGTRLILDTYDDTTAGVVKNRTTIVAVT